MADTSKPRPTGTQVSPKSRPARRASGPATPAGLLLAEVLAAVFSVRPDDGGGPRLQRRREDFTARQRREGRARRSAENQTLQVLLWQRGQEPAAGRWALPGGVVLPDEDVDDSARRQLAEKVDLAGVAHLEQLGVFSRPDRIPSTGGGANRVLAVGFLGLVPVGVDPQLPADTGWYPVDALPPTAFDHGAIVDRAHRRLQAKLSYTNIGFALAPATFTLAELRRCYAVALGHEVDPTNLHRILSRRGMLEPTGTTAPPGPAGGRPAAQFRFTVPELRVTDPFAAFRPKD